MRRLRVVLYRRVDALFQLLRRAVDDQADLRLVLGTGSVKIQRE